MGNGSKKSQKGVAKPAGAALGNSADIIDLHHQNDGDVFVQPADYDAFIMSQREAVETLGEKHRMMSARDEIQAKIDNLFMDIAKWASGNREVVSIVWTPRVDDAFIAVISADEDESGDLHDRMADLSLRLFNQYRFRLQFVLFRASEADGLDSFMDVEGARRIYPAEHRGTSHSG